MKNKRYNAAVNEKRYEYTFMMDSSYEMKKGMLPEPKDTSNDTEG